MSTSNPELPGTEETVRALLARHPNLAVLGYAAARPGMSSDVLALARAGVHELVVAGIDDVANVLRAALARSARRSSAERILGELAAFVPADTLPLLRYCLEHAAAAPTVPELARMTMDSVEIDPPRRRLTPASSEPSVTPVAAKMTSPFARSSIW